MPPYLIPYSEMDIIFIMHNHFFYMFFMVLLCFFNTESICMLKFVKTHVSKEFVKFSINKNGMLFYFFMWTWIMNIYGLFPFFFSYTTHFYFTLNMAFLSYMSNMYFKIGSMGIFFFNKHNMMVCTLSKKVYMNDDILLLMDNVSSMYKKFFMMSMSFIIKLFIVLVHIFTMTFRLTMNMVAGHLIMSVYSNSLMFLLLFIFYEMFATGMQSFIFFLMTNLYYN